MYIVELFDSKEILCHPREDRNILGQIYKQKSFHSKLFRLFYSFTVHRNETNVSECGYQLWNGAFLLCDYILTNQARFLNKIILELGAGIGLCSLIASRFVSTIICTGIQRKEEYLILKSSLYL